MAKTIEPTHFIVGTKNGNGEDASVFTDRGEAENHVRTLIEEGFEDTEIVWIEGVSKRVSANTTVIVESIAFD